MSRPSKREIHEQFRTFNADFFGGALPEVPIHWRRMLAYGACCEPCPKYPHGLIELSTMHMPPCGWRGVLLHEMVHLHLDQRGVDEWDSGEVAYHGPRFTAECNRIGALLGLPEYGDEASWYWPHAHLEGGLDEPGTDE